VWTRYAETAHFLMRKDGGSKVVLTTVAENEDLLRRLFEATSTVRIEHYLLSVFDSAFALIKCVQNFQPSIPHLVYQYNLFTNYHSSRFSEKNPEIPE
jgi:hypothetical protein